MKMGTVSLNIRKWAAWSKDILQGEGSEKKGLRGVEGKQLKPHL